MAEPYARDDLYTRKDELLYGQLDATIGAVRTSVGKQTTWFIRGGFALVVPTMTVGNLATLVIKDGGELTLVG